MLYRLPLQTDKPTANIGAYRTLFPFFLLIAVILLLMYRVVIAPAAAAQRSDCPGGDTVTHWIQPGDSCWSVAKDNGYSLEVFMKDNPKLDCERLMPGMTVCLPQGETATGMAA
jgi:hypothetical protein